MRAININNWTSWEPAYDYMSGYLKERLKMAEIPSQFAHVVSELMSKEIEFKPVTNMKSYDVRTYHNLLTGMKFIVLKDSEGCKTMFKLNN